MGKEINDDNENETARLLQEARQVLIEINAAKETAIKARDAAEIARKEADSHASYANDAKNSTEAHSKTVATCKGQSESDLASITANKLKADEQVAALSSAKGNVDAELVVISKQKQDVENSAEEIRKASSQGQGLLAEISQLKTSIAEYQSVALASQTKVTAAASSAEGLVVAIQANQTRAEESIKSITANFSSSTTNSEEIAKLLETTNADRTAMQKIFESLKKSTETSTAYEQKIKALEGSFQNLNKQIEELLPGATSVGLAEAFKTQKERFEKPQERWLLTFIICIGLLVIISVPTFIHAACMQWFSIGGVSQTQWNEIFMGFASKLPIIAPLIWLAVYAGRNYMLSLRMEEDYAYKETISRAFEGYKREMKAIADADPANVSLLTTFCDNVLRALAERPGRIYEGSHEDITPINEATKLAQRSINSAPQL